MSFRSYNNSYCEIHESVTIYIYRHRNISIIIVTIDYRSTTAAATTTTVQRYFHETPSDANGSTNNNILLLDYTVTHYNIRLLPCILV